MAEPSNSTAMSGLSAHTAQLPNGGGGGGVFQQQQQAQPTQQHHQQQQQAAPSALSAAGLALQQPPQQQQPTLQQWQPALPAAVKQEAQPFQAVAVKQEAQPYALPPLPPGGAAAALASAAALPAGAAAGAPSNASSPATSPAAAAAVKVQGASGGGDPRFSRVGFAKLLGTDGLEYFIQKYEIILGRRSKSPVDVVLGDAAVLSRQHAKIAFNFYTKRWQLLVEGKNGVHVNGVLHTPATGPTNLSSQDLLQAAELSFYFLLPKPQRKPSTKPRIRAGVTGSSVAGDEQWDEPGTPTLGSPDGDGRHACVSSPQFPGGSSPALLPSGGGRPAATGAAAPGGSAAAGAGAAAAAAGGGGGNGLQQCGSGPLLSGLGLSGLAGGGPLSPALGLTPGSVGGGFGANPLLQPAAYGLGMGDDEDEDLMEL